MILRVVSQSGGLEQMALFISFEGGEGTGKSTQTKIGRQIYKMAILYLKTTKTSTVLKVQKKKRTLILILFS